MSNNRSLEAAEPAKKGFSLRNIGSYLWKATNDSPAWPLIIVLVIFFAFQSKVFLSPFNINIILTQTVLTGLLAIGLTPLAISGNIDFSVGAIAALGSCLAIVLQSKIGFVPAIGGTLVICMGIGLFNGLIVEKLVLPSIIVTIAMGTAIHGATYLIFGARTLVAIDDAYLDLGYFEIAGVSFSVMLFIGVSILLALMLRFTIHGVHTYAIGGNRQAALDAGVNVQGHVLGNFALSGLMAGLCGVVLVTGLGAGGAVFARDYELWGIIALVLGGTKLAGGGGKISGTVVAALSLTVLRNGMNLMRIDARWFLLILGLALIIALILDRIRSGDPEVAE